MQCEKQFQTLSNKYSLFLTLLISVVNTVTMDAHELRAIISRDIRLNRQFLDVFAADELPYQIPVGGLAIVNCCERTEPGKHWIAICQETSNRLEFFDSYGFEPAMYNLENKLPISNAVVYNSKTLQSIYSDVCGQYCLYYCYFKARGYALSDIVSVFSNDYKSNDYYVRSIIFNMFNLRRYN